MHNKLQQAEKKKIYIRYSKMIKPKAFKRTRKYGKSIGFYRTVQKKKKKRVFQKYLQ